MKTLFYRAVRQLGVYRPGLAAQQPEVSRMCTVQIYDAERRFVNEIPVRTTLEGVQYADSLAKENPARIYVVLDEHRSKVYSR